MMFARILNANCALKRLFVFAGICALGAGCGRNDPSRYETTSSLARTALEAALANWKGGGRPDQIDASPQVKMIDSDWQNGSALVDFTILDESPTPSGPKEFKVRLQLERAAGPIEATYHVIGREPIYLFRDRDFQKMSGM